MPRFARVVLILLVWLGVPASALADVIVVTPGAAAEACIAAGELQAAVRELGDGAYFMAIDATAAAPASTANDANAAWRLRLVLRSASRHPRLVREFLLQPADCGQAVALIAAVLTRHFDWLAIAEARGDASSPAAPAPRAAPMPPAARRDAGRGRPAWSLVGTLTASVNALPQGAGGGGGLRLQRAPADGPFSWHGLLTFRRELPVALANGRYHAVAYLLGVGWRMRLDRQRVWQLGAGLRGGVIRVWGEGFARNQKGELPWFEAEAALGRAWRRGGLELAVAATSLRATASITRGDATAQTKASLPPLRIGLTWVVPIWQNKARLGRDGGKSRSW